MVMINVFISDMQSALYGFIILLAGFPVISFTEKTNRTKLKA